MHFNRSTYTKKPKLTRGAARFSRKVFVGGLPIDANEQDISKSFEPFGLHSVDWPYRRIDGSCYPPKGYCFLLFNGESSVRKLIDSCKIVQDRYYWTFQNSSGLRKLVQVSYF